MTKSEKKLESKLKKHAGAINGFELDKEKYTNGLVTNRKPTDVFFCLLFVAYILALFGIAGYSLYHGQPKKLVAHQDGERRFCGIDEAVKDYPKVYWTFEANDFTKSAEEEMFMSAVCIKECPTKTENRFPDCVNTKYSKICNEEGKSGSGAQVYATHDIFGMCIVKDAENLPQNVKDKFHKFMEELKQGDSGKVIEDLSNSWCDIVICLILSIVYALVYMYCMSRFPTAIAYTAVIFIELIFVIGGGACIVEGFKQTDETRKRGMLIGGAVFVLFGLIFNLMLCCYWSSFKVGIAIIDATADFFVATQRFLLVSIGTFFMQLGLILTCVTILLCICSSGEIKPSDSVLDITRQGKDFDLNGQQHGFVIALFFGFLWVANYLEKQTVLTLMCSVSTYYFSSNANGEGSAEVKKALYWSHFYHAGSVALGSLILAIVDFLQAFLDSVQSESDNAAARCVQCCLKCIEEIVEYINTIAYANMAVSGDSFCTSAWNGFIINLKHLAKFYFAQTLAKMFVLIGFLFVTYFNVLSYLVVSKTITKSYDEINHQLLPIVIIIVFTLSTCAIFMGLFDEAVVATLQCMGVDRQLSPDGDCKYGPPTFHEKLRKIYGDDYGKPVQVH